MKNKKLWIFLFFLLLFLLALFFLPVKEIFQGNVLRFLQDKAEENFIFSAFLYLVLCALAGAFWLCPESPMRLSPGQSFMLFGERFSVLFLQVFPQESLFLWGDTFSMMLLSLNWRRILT